MHLPVEYAESAATGSGFSRWCLCHSVHTIGAVVLIAFGDRINSILKAMRSGVLGTALQIAMGCGLVVFAVYHWRRPRGRAKRTRDKARPAGGPARTFVFGVTLTAIDLLTAIPYVGGLSSIAGGRLSVVAELALLAMYNVIYIAPPLALVLVLRRYGDASIVAIGRMRLWLSRVFADRRWAVVLGLAGLGLITLSATA
jgi:cytochrome c biogenesis protein CcdA